MKRYIYNIILHTDDGDVSVCYGDLNNLRKLHKEGYKCLEKEALRQFNGDGGEHIKLFSIFIYDSKDKSDVFEPIEGCSPREALQLLNITIEELSCK